MKLNFKNKEIIVNNIHKIVNKSISITIANIHKVTTNEINKIRQLSHNCKSNIHFKLIKNTLFKLAIKNSKFSYINNQLLKGHILIGFSFSNPSYIAKIFHNLHKINHNLIIKFIALDNKIFTSTKEINLVINLPSYKESLIKLIYLLKYISILKFLLLIKIFIQIKKK